MEKIFTDQLLLKLAEIVPYGVLTLLAMLINYLGFKRSSNNMQLAFKTSTETMERSFDKSLKSISDAYLASRNHNSNGTGTGLN